MFKKEIIKKSTPLLILFITLLFFSSSLKSQEREQVDRGLPKAFEQIPSQVPYKAPQAQQVNEPTPMEEIRFNLGQASQSIASHDYDAAADYVDRAVVLFQDVQGKGGVGEGELAQVENEIFITHQQAIIGQRKREYDATHIPGKLKNQAQVPSQGSYYDMWSIDRHPWQPD